MGRRVRDRPRRPRIQDPLLREAPVGADREPARSRLLKGARAEGEPAAATPPIGRGARGLLELLGPGLVTGASDDDPSGIGTYSQVGSQFGFGVLWTALFTFPLMLAVQELCARIALAATGATAAAAVGFLVSLVPGR